MEIPSDLRYSATHEWISSISEGIVTVGITDFAQDQLGDVVFVELPKVGASVTQGDAVAVVESVKTASDIYAPVGGKIVEVNGDLENSPEKINLGPYTGGWIFKLRVDNPNALKGLLDAATYQATTEES